MDKRRAVGGQDVRGLGGTQCAFRGLDGSGHYRNVDRLQDRLRGREVDPVLEDLVELERKSILEFKEMNCEQAQELLQAAFREQQPVCHCQECAELPYQDDERRRCGRWYWMKDLERLETDTERYIGEKFPRRELPPGHRNARGRTRRNLARDRHGELIAHRKFMQFEERYEKKISRRQLMSSCSSVGQLKLANLLFQSAETKTALRFGNVAV